MTVITFSSEKSYRNLFSGQDTFALICTIFKKRALLQLACGFKDHIKLVIFTPCRPKIPLLIHMHHQSDD